MRIETLTVNELAEEMRGLGLHVNNAILPKAIAAGVYPFALAYMGESGKYHVEIYRKLFRQWVDARATEDGAAS